MQQETRSNLIFVVALLALTLPGIVILVRKKMTQPPRESLGALAAPVRTHVMYVDPIPQGPRLQQVVPPRTREWAASLSPWVAARPADSVVNSDKRSFELIDTVADADALRFTLLLWDPRLPTSPGSLSFTLLDGDQWRPGQIESVEPLVLPEPVLKELRINGYMTPPERIHRVAVRFEGRVEPGGELRLVADAPHGPAEDRLDLPAADIRPRQ